MSYRQPTLAEKKEISFDDNLGVATISLADHPIITGAVHAEIPYCLYNVSCRVYPHNGDGYEIKAVIWSDEEHCTLPSSEYADSVEEAKQVARERATEVAENINEHMDARGLEG
jgi:hypothetical protein